MAQMNTDKMEGESRRTCSNKRAQLQVFTFYPIRVHLLFLSFFL
jgi:hypothetical protein